MAPIKFKSLKTFNKGKSEFRFNDYQESRFGTRVVFLKISCYSKVWYKKKYYSKKTCKVNVMLLLAQPGYYVKNCMLGEIF